MATTAPHVKLLRQLSNAKDEYQSGALDIAWDGGSATIFLVFGQPSHAVLQSAGRHLEGQAAFDALLLEMPRQFAVGDWRRAMSPVESLSVSLEDLTETVAQLAGAQSEDLVDDESFAWLSGEDDSPELGFGYDDFPLLPTGPELWPEASAADVGLSKILSTLPSGVVILNGRRLRAAGVVHGGELIDAVWVDAEDHARGDTAVMAILGAREGALAGYALEGPEVVEALPMLWRCPVVSRVDIAWVDPQAMVVAFQADGASRAVLVDGPISGVGLFNRGQLVAVYSSAQRVPVRSPEALVELLSQTEGSVRVRQQPSTAQTRRPAQPAVAELEAPSTDTADPFWPAEAAAAPATNGWFVDYEPVRRELVQIAMTWLGDSDSGPVTRLLERMPPTLDDFVSAIDDIRVMEVTGHDPSAVHAMAREMHHHAAERLCGA